jgi:predicted SprT family Zn-dependent metalloprotease
MIPKSFHLAGLKITVKLDLNLYRDHKVVGEARYPQQQIILDSRVLSEDFMEQNFFHELVHWIFYILNEESLQHNEKLVDTMAFLLHQSLKTNGGDMYTSEELEASRHAP